MVEYSELVLVELTDIDMACMMDSLVAAERVG